MEQSEARAVPISPEQGEEVGLINGQTNRNRSMKIKIIWGIGMLATLMLVGAAGYTLANGSGYDKGGEREGEQPRARNVIMMISDGFGPASETFARNYYQFVHGKDLSWQSPLDEILVGASRTRSSNSLVTDSAAGATAFSCAMKSYNGAIGVDPEGKACGTVLEAAKRKGLLTGLVATSRITHATPAAFSAHVVNRNMEDLIAQYQIGNYSLGRTVDLMLGGGRCHFVPMSTPNSCRTDEVDVLKAAQEEYGFTHLSNGEQLQKISPSNYKLPLLGLFSDDHMEYEIDRAGTDQPHLSEMADKALQLLKHASEGKPEGFFLMIEGSRIDMAAHANDPAAHAHDVEAYWQTIEVVKKFVNDNPGTVMVSVSDHETGGLTVGRQLNSTYPEYLWRPEAIEPVQRSMENVALELTAIAPKDRNRFIKKSVLGWMGIKDATEDELKVLNSAIDYYEIRNKLTSMISTRALIGWTTHGHTGVDVNLYAHGTGADYLRGNHENTDIGTFIIKALDLDIDSVTKAIQNDSTHQPTRSAPEKFLYRRSTGFHGMHYHDHIH